MKKINAIVISFVLICAVFISGCFGPENKTPTAIIIASPLSGETPLTVLFNASGSSDVDGTISTYAWDFGDGTTSTGIIASNVFTDIGSYIVTLYVTDDKGKTGEVTVTINVNEPSVFTQKQAIDLLMGSIIIPGASEDRISAFMLPQTLVDGDVVTSEGGETYNITEDTWFIFIDDLPNSFYSHPTRYVFINAKDGSYEVIDEFWPPLINDFSMWADTSHGKGEVIEFYPVVTTGMAITPSDTSTAPQADYGDAPDNLNAYTGIQGRFPTLFNTTNSKFGLAGGHCLNVGEETLGPLFSAEIDANDPNDPDIVPNLVDSDKDDRIFVYLNGKKAKISFTVYVSSIAPNVMRYANILVDFDQSGNWTNGTYGHEWPIKNMEIKVEPGNAKTFITPEFSWGNQTVLPSPVWIRVALTREKVNETIFANGGWDGSGQYEYGEIEDHIVYLTDDPEPEDEWPPWPKNPPGGKDPNPQPPGDPEPPGPSKGPCGTDVNYYCIIISGGDSSDHMGKGQTPAQDAVDTMTDLTSDQGYTNAGSLSPSGSGSSSNSIANIASALSGLQGSVKCGDHILIYIVGHGNKADHKNGPGINMKGSDGKTDDLLTPETLGNMLSSSLPACPDEDCDVPGKCCHVQVVIESCYAGSFNTPGVTGPGRTVIGSSDDEPAAAGSGGVFTQGFAESSRDSDSDTNDETGVDAGEAFGGASDSVSNNNNKSGRSQEPWKDSQECECKCPCSPNITTNKTVMDLEGFWVDEIDASIGQILQFDIEVKNTGKCRNVTTLVIVDTIPVCLNYTEGSAEMYLNGEFYKLREPCTTEGGEGESAILTWNCDEIEFLAPGETVSIRYSAIPEIEGENTNIVDSNAQCTYDPEVFVESSDSVTVNVV